MVTVRNHKRGSNNMLIKTDYEIKVAEAIETAMDNDANYNPKSGNILWDLFDIETFMLVRTKDTKENIQEYSAIFAAFKEEVIKHNAA
jgi:trehalose-6-phosphate synthase